MRKFYYMLLAIIATFALGSSEAVAQKVSVNIEGLGTSFSPLDKPHEVRLNLLSSTLFLHPEVSYEYAFNKELSAGARIAFAVPAVGVPNSQLGVFSFLPYGRWHFYRSIPSSSSGTSVRGFFVELNLATCYYGKSDSSANKDYPNNTTYKLDRTPGFGLGLGLGLGYKWITPKAWTFELGAYLGRDFVNPDESIPLYGNYLVSIGKRF